MHIGENEDGTPLGWLRSLSFSIPEVLLGAVLFVVVCIWQGWFV